MAKPSTTWWKVLTESRTNPKFMAAGPVASWVWYCANCWARETLSDGFIPVSAFPTLVPGMAAKRVLAAAEVLVSAKLFRAADGGGYLINDFLKHHPSRDYVKSGQAQEAVRKRTDRSTLTLDLDTMSAADTARTERGHDSLSAADSARTRRGHGADATSISLSDLLTLSEDQKTNTEDLKDHPIKHLLTVHQSCFEAVNGGAKPAKYTGADAKHAKNLITQHGILIAEKIIRQAFLTRDPFVTSTGRSMGVIVSSAVQNKLIAELSGGVSHGDGLDGLRDFIKHG
jgi:hypothetical protein